MQQPILSIIIPHKNSAKTLQRLLESISLQLPKEVIIVDDNSHTDELEQARQLADAFGATCLHNEGVGAGGARNTGMKAASGKWLLFADSDDFFLPTMPQLVQRHIDSEADIVYFNATSCVSETLQPASRDLHVKEMIRCFSNTGREGYLRCKLLAPWGKLIRRSLIEDNQIRFEERIAGNDMWFSALSGIRASKIVCDPSPLYCVTISSGSITTTLSKERFDQRFRATMKVNRLVRHEGHGKFQTSLLYFMGKSYQFGIPYFLSVLCCALGSGTNPLIGFSKIFKFRKALEQRQSSKYTVKQH